MINYRALWDEMGAMLETKPWHGEGLYKLQRFHHDTAATDFIFVNLPPKPDWVCRNEADVNAFTAWNNVHLWRRMGERIIRLHEQIEATDGVVEVTHNRINFYNNEDIAIQAAHEFGDIEPARMIWPEAVSLLKAPPRKGKGQYIRARYVHLDNAMEDVRFLHELWFQIFGARRRKYRPTAEKIAADFHDVDLGVLESRLSNRSKTVS